MAAKNYSCLWHVPEEWEWELVSVRRKTMCSGTYTPKLGKWSTCNVLEISMCHLQSIHTAILLILWESPNGEHVVPIMHWWIIVVIWLYADKFACSCYLHSLVHEVLPVGPMFNGILHTVILLACIAWFGDGAWKNRSVKVY